MAPTKESSSPLTRHLTCSLSSLVTIDTVDGVVGDPPKRNHLQRELNMILRNQRLMINSSKVPRMDFGISIGSTTKLSGVCVIRWEMLTAD
jgi:hypothetical protein